MTCSLLAGNQRSVFTIELIQYIKSNEDGGDYIHHQELPQGRKNVNFVIYANHGIQDDIMPLPPQSMFKQNLEDSYLILHVKIIWESL